MINNVLRHFNMEEANVAGCYKFFAVQLQSQHIFPIAPLGSHKKFCRYGIFIQMHVYIFSFMDLLVLELMYDMTK